MVTGYFIRQEGERWQLIEQDETYQGRVILDGLPPERAAKLYWRYMRDFLKERTKEGTGAGADALSSRGGCAAEVAKKSRWQIRRTDLV